MLQACGISRDFSGSHLRTLTLPPLGSKLLWILFGSQDTEGEKGGGGESWVCLRGNARSQASSASTPRVASSCCRGGQEWSPCVPLIPERRVKAAPATAAAGSILAWVRGHPAAHRGAASTLRLDMSFCHHPTDTTFGIIAAHVASQSRDPVRDCMSSQQILFLLKLARLEFCWLQLQSLTDAAQGLDLEGSHRVGGKGQLWELGDAD